MESPKHCTIKVTNGVSSFDMFRLYYCSHKLGVREVETLAPGLGERCEHQVWTWGLWQHQIEIGMDIYCCATCARADTTTNLLLCSNHLQLYHRGYAGLPVRGCEGYHSIAHNVDKRIKCPWWNMSTIMIYLTAQPFAGPLPGDLLFCTIETPRVYGRVMSTYKASLDRVGTSSRQEDWQPSIKSFLVRAESKSAPNTSANNSKQFQTGTLLKKKKKKKGLTQSAEDMADMGAWWVPLRSGSRKTRKIKRRDSDGAIQAAAVQDV